MTIEIKTRTWWKPNPVWPDGREPSATPWDKAHKITEVDTEDEARAFCAEWNASHDPGPMSRKAEWSSK